MAWVTGAAAARQHPKKSSGSSFWRLLRWGILLALVFVIVQMLRKPAPAAATIKTPQQRAADAASFRSKLESLQDAHERGYPGRAASFTEDELNGYIQHSIATLGSQAGGAVSAGLQQNGLPGTGALASVGEDAQAAAARAAESAQVGLLGDQITVQMTVNRFGKDFTFSLTGKLAAEAGYATFHPTSCKLGLLSVPLTLVDGVIQQKLAEPENREKMKLPDFIDSIRVENGQLIVVEK